MTERNLGKLQSTHGIAPVFLQRAAIVVVVSFVFFIIMIIAFSIRQNIGYFLLATAFLIVQLFTLFGWITQKRTEFRLFENGFTYKKHVCAWNEIESLKIAENRLGNQEKNGCEIKKRGGEKIILSGTVQDIQKIIEKIEVKSAKRK